MTKAEKRDHGGGVDAAAARYGGDRADWIDLSTGINPVPYPLPDLPPAAWTTLPDSAANEKLLEAARRFWRIPQEAAVLAVPGASAAIAQIPRLFPATEVDIPAPTYNEHAASFIAEGWRIGDGNLGTASVHVHPNNPDGKEWSAEQITGALRVIDESFCDIMPECSLISEALKPGTLVLKSFGKFWGLAGLRLGFVIGDTALVAKLAAMLGPWPVSGPALEIGSLALSDDAWAQATRQRLHIDADRLDALMARKNVVTAGGCSLFRLYDVADAKAWQTELAAHQIWSRVFPYNPRWLRLGIPGPDDWSRIETALK